MPGITTTGAVSMTDLNTEFGKGYSLSLYRGITVYPTAGGDSKTNVATGSISYSFFQGYRNLAPPGVPTGLSYSITYNVDRTIAYFTMSWVAPTTGGALDNYTYVFTTDGTELSDNTAEVTASKDMSSGLTYNFKVRANNASGSSEYSPMAITTVYPGSDNQSQAGYYHVYPPGKPTTSYSKSGTTFTMTWVAVPEAETYGIGPATSFSYILYTIAGDGATSASTETTASSGVTATMSAGNSYQFKVRAFNDNATSSAYSDLTPSPAYYYPNRPPAPTGVTVYFTSRTLNISWTAPSGPINSYTVTVSASGLAAVSLTGITTTSTTYTTLSSGKSYYATVVGINDAGTGTTSSSSSSITYPLPPGTPTNPTQSFTNGSYNMSWTAPTIDTNYGAPNQYICFVKVNGGTAVTLLGPISDTPATSLTYTTTITSGSSYSFSVGARNYASIIFGTTGYTTAITYPSPTSLGATNNPTASGNTITFTGATTGGGAPTSYSVQLYSTSQSTATGGTAVGTAVTSPSTSGTYAATASTKFYAVTTASNVANSPAPTSTSGLLTFTYTPPATVSVTAPTFASSSLSYTATINANGSSLTSYSVILYGGSTALATTSSGLNTTGTANSFTYTPVAGTSYYVTVSATNVAGASSATSTSATYSPPSTFTVQTPSIFSGTLTFYWNLPTTIAKYGVVYLYDDINGSPLDTVSIGPTATSTERNSYKTYSSLVGTRIYKTRVIGYNDQGSTTIDSATVTYSPPTVTASTPTQSGNTITYSGTQTGATISFLFELYSIGTGTTATGGTSVSSAYETATYAGTASGNFYTKTTASNNQGTSTIVSGVFSFTYTTPLTLSTPTAPTIVANTISFTAAAPTAGTATTYSAQLYYNTTNTNTGGSPFGDELTAAGSGSGRGGGNCYVFLRVTATNAAGTVTQNSSVVSYTYVTPPTGGTKSTSGTYKVHAFTTVGASSFVLYDARSVTIVGVGGGGGGGGANKGKIDAGGGGGGGNVVKATYTLAAGTYTVYVGDGGLLGPSTAAGSSLGSTGGNTYVSLGTITDANPAYIYALGGGGGGAGGSVTAAYINAPTGSSSGGGATNYGVGSGSGGALTTRVTNSGFYYYRTASGIAATDPATYANTGGAALMVSYQAIAGGFTVVGNMTAAGGGGGGASAAGAAASSGSGSTYGLTIVGAKGGDGGAGVALGEPLNITLGGGGGGGGWWRSGTGGSGGGANGADPNNYAPSGTINTGGGGGGAIGAYTYTNNPAASIWRPATPGGSGVVYIYYTSVYEV